MLTTKSNKMKNKDNIFKLIARTLIICFVLFSLYSVAFMQDVESAWMILPFAIGSLGWMGIIAILFFAFVGICIFLITQFLNWAFNTDYFD